ncbi:MAG: hypothetical protein K1X36_02475 [Pyrinomonadaceae bacterium]|nr:hypothetical protein [Pyrinomonadaceae bacterium]
MKVISALLLLTVYICVFALSAKAAQTDIVGPAGSDFGSIVTVLPNGNIVVTAPLYDIPAGASDVGAVFLYDGATLTLISTLTGSTTNDQVGGGGVTVLTNGNFVVSSGAWDNPSPIVANVGAVTWCSGVTGCNGVVSSANSLVGSRTSDTVGSNGVTALPNGNYVVKSPGWDNPSPLVTNAGAVTWGNGTSGTIGVVSSSNSLVGGSATDQVGLGGVTALTNGNYVVISQGWDNPSPVVTDVGAVTWGNGSTGTSGVASAVNSLIGSSAFDQVGFAGVTALTNGNYVVNSRIWNNPSPALSSVGAVTWGNGATGTSGVVSSANSLIGSTAGDNVAVGGVVALTNGNYVVSSYSWSNPLPSIAAVGAVTWGNGTNGTNGVISSSNSLIGSTASDQVGSNGVTALTNGNYVISSSNWDSISPVVTNVGAATWGNGASGTSGVVSSANSLIGSAAGEFLGATLSVTALTNGNYTVRNSNWNGLRGSVTWGNGTSGTSGVVSAANSLVGSSSNDRVGSGIVTALTNGNYVVVSPFWDNSSPLTADVGAVTWGNGASGTIGTVSSANSLIGGSSSDQVGSGVVTPLSNGNYVVGSPNWDIPSPVIMNVGAVTWGNGLSGTSGVVSSANSLIGSTSSDQVGANATALTNGNYVVLSPNWDNGANTNAGAMTWCNGSGSTIASVSSSNSLIGGTASDFIGSGTMTVLPNGNYSFRTTNWDNTSPILANATAVTFASGFGGTAGVITDGASGGNSVVGTVANGTNTSAFDATRNRLVVGRQASNTVSILSFSTTAIADGDITNAVNWSAGVPNGLVTGIIPSGRSMTVSTKVNAGMIHVQCGGALTNSSSSAYVIGSIRRDFCSAVNGNVLFPVGDPTNYSPMRSSGVNGSGSITVSAIDGFMPGINATASSLSRYWSVSGSGVVANLTFQYVDADVNGTEANYRVFRRPISNNSLITQHALFSLNTASNTITANNVSRFSDWSASAQSLAPPTAAGASISGRVLTPDGFGIRNAVVAVAMANGERLQANTGTFGYFWFDGIESGQTVTVTVASKRYLFSPQLINILDNVADVEFVAIRE